VPGELDPEALLVDGFKEASAHETVHLEARTADEKRLLAKAQTVTGADHPEGIVRSETENKTGTLSRPIREIRETRGSDQSHVTTPAARPS